MRRTAIRNTAAWPAAVLAAACVSAAPAMAQDASDSATQVEELTVTARKRVENIQEVPIAVTAFSTKTIEDARLDRIDDFVALTPNLQIRATNARTSGMDIVIRGVASDINQEPGFGLYQDGVYIGGIAKAFGNFSDLSRVEVLRGPQGALYGRNAVGGSINIITAEPEQAVGAKADALYGRYERKELRGMVNVPLGDTVALRLSGFLIDQDKGEYVNQTLGEQLDGEESRGLRAKLRWQAMPDLAVRWTAEVVDEKTHGNPRLNVAAGETPRTLRYNTPNRNTLEGHQYVQDVVWSPDFMTVTAILSYRDEDLTALADFDQTATQSLTLAQTVERQNTYAELRFASPAGQDFSWLFGITYYGEDRKSRLNTDVDLGLGFLGASFASLQTFSNSDLETRSWAAFGEVGYRAGPWELGASVRASRDEKTLGYVQGIPELIGLPGPFAAFSGAPFQLSRNDSQRFENVSPGASLTWRFSDDVNLYAKVGTGFRAGGFNTVVSNPDFLPYDAETSVNWEVGLKSELLDRRLRFNLAAFRLDQDDIIVSVIDPNPVFASIGQTYDTNAGTARTLGLEADITARPMPGLDIMLNVGVLDATLTNFRTATGVNVSGNEPPGAGKGTLGALVSYRWPLGEALEGFVNAKYNQTWGGYQDVENLIPLDDHGVLDLKLGVEAEHWRLIAYADNVTDQKWIINRNAAYTSVAYARGQTYGVQLVWAW